MTSQQNVPDNEEDGEMFDGRSTVVTLMNFERLPSHFLLDSFLLTQYYLQNWSVSMCPTIRHF